MMNVLEFRKR